MTDRDQSSTTTAKVLYQAVESPSLSLAAPPAAIGCALAIAASAVWLRIRRRGPAAAGTRFGRYTSDPVAPSRRISSPVPAGLEQLILSCLAKVPGQRPASAAALRDGLEPLAAAWTQVDAARCWRRHAAGRTADAPSCEPSRFGRGEEYAMTALAA